MSKWKELPACESVDGFKVGDKIRTYDIDRVCDREITRIAVDFVYCQKEPFHFKQCRKLVPVEPREWTLFKDKNGIEVAIKNTDPFPGKPNSYTFTCNVREVLEDE